MKIEDIINSKDSLIMKDRYIFKEGSLIKGKILSVDDDYIVIHVKDFGIIRAKSEESLNHYKNKTLSFIIKEILPDKIQLKPIFNNMEKKTSYISIDRDEYLLNVLKEFDIKPSPISLDFLENLMRFNLPINKENLVNGIGILDRLQQLLTLQEDEAIILVDSRQDAIDIRNEDIRNLLIVKDNKDIQQTDTKENINVIIEEISKISSTNKTDQLLQKTIIFFRKYNIKPTLNNIKYFLELNENSTLFSKDFEIWREVIDKKFTNYLKKIMMDSDTSKKTIESNQSTYNDNLNSVLDYIKYYKLNVNKSLRDDFEELTNKIKFLKEINKELIFMYIPLILDDNIKDTVVTLLKKRKKKTGHNDKINLFINLNTKRLGKVTIHCVVSDVYIDVNFCGINKEDISLFKAKEDELRALIETADYYIRTIEYEVNNSYSILDSLIVNSNTVYNLDVQV